MTEEKTQFDSLLGGTEELPRSMTLSKFVAFRCQEIQVMKNSLISQTGTKLAFQTLPKHMRRRAMSHNVKRLPRRLRQIHLNQMKKSGMPAKQKRPSRKYRRKPRNLTEEYTKRSDKRYKWLQTHIWHAKRFHMVEKWGYKLPCHPRDKAFRACYRATTQHCLLQDISYFNCVEISGDKKLIIENFKQIHKPNTGLSIGAKAFLNGNREGELTLFEVGKFFQRSIGTINYHWQPCQENKVSKIWLWIHAAFYNNVLNTLIKCFNLSLIDTESEIQCYTNNSSGINLLELKGELSRFRLIGPLANSILQDAFVLLDINNVNLEQSWLKEYIKQNDNNQIEADQSLYWNMISNITSTSEISPHTILSLIVKDPRFNLPKKRIKCVPAFGEYSESAVVNNISASSPLFESEIRKETNKNKITNSKIHELQSKLLVRGTDLEDNAAFIPVILIQRPGSKKENIGLCSGWDLILPSTWAKHFWISFILRGARVGGLRESKSILFEMGKSQFLQPDTEAGVEEECQTTQECIEKFFKKPPNKRTNYNKFNIVSPFHYNWRLLIQDWRDDASPVEEFIVLNDKKMLAQIELLLTSKTNFIPKYPENCLIPIKLECEKRGSPSQFAIICLPKLKNDLKQIAIEPSCIDKNQIERRELRHAHKSLLNKLRKRRKIGSTINVNLADFHKGMLTKYTKKMRELWLPEPTSIRNSCSREVMGFVTKGGFSFSHGKCCATGYITADALPSLVKSHFRNKVLVRNTNTRRYKVAKLSIIIE